MAQQQQQQAAPPSANASAPWENVSHDLYIKACLMLRQRPEHASDEHKQSELLRLKNNFLVRWGPHARAAQGHARACAPGRCAPPHARAHAPAHARTASNRPTATRGTSCTAS